MDTVTIGIPTYNQAAYIKQTIEGCLQQTYARVRVVIGDDRSTDGSEKIIQPFTKDSRVEYILNEKNLGRVGNYHKLLYDHSDSPWYVNLDGDDYFSDPEFLSHVMKIIERYPREEIAFFQGNHDITQLRKILPNHEMLNDTDLIVDGRDFFLNFSRIQKFTHCATVYNREKAIGIDFYNYDCLFTDFQSVSRLSLLGKVILSSRKVAVWREHAGNESKSLNEKNLERELASLESIALFAEKHLGKDIAANWLKQMKDYYRLVFIYHNTTVSPGMSTILFIVKHWRFNWLYPKYIIKNILLKMGYSFKPKSQ